LQPLSALPNLGVTVPLNNYPFIRRYPYAGRIRRLRCFRRCFFALLFHPLCFKFFFVLFALIDSHSWQSLGIMPTSVLAVGRRQILRGISGFLIRAQVYYPQAWRVFFCGILVVLASRGAA
jgi:hypothetical protein